MDERNSFEDNIVELGDFFIFDYNETIIFHLKLPGRTRCVKKGAGGFKLVVKEEEVEEMNVEHQKSVEPKENTWVSLEEDDDKEEEEEDDDDNDEENEYKEEEEEKERTCIFNK
ncbi:hypothetical protein RDI58_013451 [Solanum bulbocastanum]|uniref:Uncharacterized protein n=1 Tax=Solanum bulbocastanum TaxID=147425 RepID=A0AAN8TTN2_SOLBU